MADISCRLSIWGDTKAEMERWHKAQYICSFSIISAAGPLYRPLSHTHRHTLSQTLANAFLSNLLHSIGHKTMDLAQLVIVAHARIKLYKCNVTRVWNVLASCVLYDSSTSYDFINILLPLRSVLPLLMTATDILPHCLCVQKPTRLCMYQCVTVMCECVCLCGSFVFAYELF